jgi:hypothetical protein
VSGQRALQVATAPAEQPNSRAYRCYTAAQIIGFLQISVSSFFEMKRRGQLPFLEELRPRLGRTVRYRADLVDRYLSGRWQSVGSHTRHGAAVVPVSSNPLKGVR